MMTWINLQVMFVFLLGMIVGMVFLYWMLYGTAATAAPFFRLWNYCRTCFCRRRVDKGQGKGYGSNTWTWSSPPTTFQIENLTPNRALGPAITLARKGKWKGKNKDKPQQPATAGEDSIRHPVHRYNMSSDSEQESSGYTDMPALVPSTSTSSSESSGFNAPIAGYTGVLTVLRHFRVDVSHLSRTASRHLRDLLVRTPPTMNPLGSDNLVVLDSGSNSNVAAAAADSSGDLRQRGKGKGKGVFSDNANKGKGKAVQTATPSYYTVRAPPNHFRVGYGRRWQDCVS
jgi:hypothetical protein